MGVSPIQVTTGQLTAGALMMLPVALIVDQPWTQALPPLEAWAAIVALASSAPPSAMCSISG